MTSNWWSTNCAVSRVVVIGEMEMETDGALDNARRTWESDWRARVVARVRSYGYKSISDFLSRFPGEPYVDVVKRLGEDVAAIQLEFVQFDETKQQGTVRDAAIDSLLRDLSWHLKAGWEGGVRGNFKTSGAYVDWLRRLDGSSRNLPPNRILSEQGQMVWNALEELRPPLGWLPTGLTDPFIQAAFARAWPVCGAGQR